VLAGSPRNRDQDSQKQTSDVDVWAVGSRIGTGGDKTLIVHWNGSAWKRVPSPSP
jgi:hypothetical protein